MAGSLQEGRLEGKALIDATSAWQSGEAEASEAQKGPSSVFEKTASRELTFPSWA